MSKHLNSNLLHVATLGKTVGIKGDMKFHIKSDFPEQFKKGATFFIDKKNRLTLSDVNLNRGLVKINNISNPEDVKKFINVKLYSSYEDTRENCHLDKGQFFWFDIEDCKVFENDICLGKVQEVLRMTLSDYLSIVTDENLVKKGFSKSFLLPYEPKFIVDTDIEKKVIIVNDAMDILEAS